MAFIPRRAIAVAGLALSALFGIANAQSQQTSDQTGPPSLEGGPVRLRAPVSQAKRLEEQLQRPLETQQQATDLQAAELAAFDTRRLSEFERHVQRVTGDRRLRRFVWKQERPAQDSWQLPVPAGQRAVPDDYVVAVGDEIRVAYWGSLDADLTLTVDRQGRVTIPRVGSIPVAGRRQSELHELIERYTRRFFKQFELQVNLGALRPVRVIVSGFVERPGAYAVNALSSVSSVLIQQAGGPSEAGSYRQVELRRGNKVLSHIDLYELMVEGRQASDLLLQEGDVIHVGALGRQVAVAGSVNRPGIYELKDKESLADLLRVAGGFAPIADRNKLALQSLAPAAQGTNVRELSAAELPLAQPQSGDILFVSNAVGTQLPRAQRAIRVRVEGEVPMPGTYVLPAGSRLDELVQRAGGLTANAYLFAAELSREAVREAQQIQIDRAIRDIALEMGRQTQPLASRSPEEQMETLRQRRQSEVFLARLREMKPNGRVVLPVEPGSNRVPEVELVDGDVLRIPTMPSEIGVYGSVFQSGGFAYQPERGVEHYLNLAGSSQRSADTRSIYLLRANGSVLSARQGGFFSRGDAMYSAKLHPGDTIIVPEDPYTASSTQTFKDWTQILYQLGVGLAAVISVSK